MRLKKIISAAVSAVMLGTCCIGTMPVSADDEYTCEMTNAGHSGSASGTGLFIGTAGANLNGNNARAPFIQGTTGSNSVTVGSNRIGVMEFSLNGSIDPEKITSAVLNIYVNSVNENYKDSDWMLLAAYETSNPTLTYAVGNMNESHYPAVNSDYSYDAAFWTNEHCSRSDLGWKTINVTRAVVNALKSGNDKVVLRLQVPAAGLNVSTTGADAPYIKLATTDKEKHMGVIKTVDQDGNKLAEDVPFEAFEGSYTYNGAIESVLKVDGKSYLYDENASTTTIDITADGPNEIILVYNYVDEGELFSGNVLIDKGATCWFADPRSVKFEHEDIYENGKLVLPASSKTIVGAIDTAGTVKAIQYDNLTETIVSVVIDTDFEPDDHNNPTFLYLPDHRIMVLWSEHTSKPFWYYRVTTEPDDITTFGEKKTVSVEGYGNYTYPSPFYMTDAPDSFFVCWRGVSWHPTIAKYSLPDENGDIVCEIKPTQMVQATGARPYVKYGSNGKDRIYFTFTTAHPDNDYPNWVYYSEIDINTLDLYDIYNNRICEGKNLPLGKSNKIGHTDAARRDYASIIVDDPSNRRDWVWDVAKDTDGNPVILFTRITENKNQHDYYYAKWNPETKVWDKTFIADGGGKFHQNPDNLELCYSGGMCLDHSDPSIVYLSKPTAGLFGSKYEIWKLEMDGVNVTSETQITKNSKYNNMRPFVAWGSSSDDLISLTWMNGDYYYWIANSTYPDAFPTSIMTLNAPPEFDYSHSMDNITIPEIITSDFVLPNITYDGFAITWTSSDSSVIDGSGYITPSDENKKIILTAKIDNGAEKQFEVTIAARNVMKNNKVLGYKFESEDIYDKDGVKYVTDTSGNGNDAAVYGSAKVDGGVLDLTANTASFASNGYAMAPAGVLSGVRSYSFALRVKANNFNNQPRFYDFGQNSGNSVFLRGSAFSAGAKYNNGTTAMINSSTALAADREYFLTVTFDGKTKTTKIYVDGKLDTQGTNITAEPYLFGQSARNYIGRTQWWDSTSGGDNLDFCGTIDDFYMFDIALTEGEIAKLMAGDDGYEADEPKTEFDASVTVGETDITVDITRGDGNENAVIIVASYSSDGRMTKAVIADDDSVILPKENAETVKVFCWESLENLKPVCDPIVIPI